MNKYDESPRCCATYMVKTPRLREKVCSRPALYRIKASSGCFLDYCEKHKGRVGDVKAPGAEVTRIHTEG